MKSGLIKRWRIDSTRQRFSLPLNSIFNWCIKHQKPDRMLIVIGMERSHGRWRVEEPRAERWVKKYLGEFIIETFLAQGWPGNLLSYAPARVFVLQFSNKVEKIILDKEPRLENWGDWRRPPLPEDICLFRSDDSHPIFVSTVHERDAWLFSEKRPRLKGLSEDTSVNIEEYFFKGKYFCLPWAYGKKLHPNYKPVRVFRKWGNSGPPL